MEPLIKPGNFYSDTPPERIIGSECEYVLQNAASRSGKPIELAQYISRKAIGRAGFKYAAPGNRRFLSNGGALYVDIDCVEYNSPEGLGPVEAAALDIAGIDITSAVIAASELPHFGLYRMSGSLTSYSGQTVTTGYHENYAVPREITLSPLIRYLLPAYAASSTWGMSGLVHEKQYVFSQKVWGLDLNDPPLSYSPETRSLTMKPMFMMHKADSDKDIIGRDSGWARVERRFADPGFSPEVRFLQFATMSLMLRMVEQRKILDPKALDRIKLHDPTRAANIFATDLSMTETVPTARWEKVTAYDIQRELIRIAYELDEKIKLPDDESRAIRLWDEVVEKFSKSDARNAKYGRLVKVLDVAAKHVVLAHSLGGSDKVNGYNLNAVSSGLVWDRVLPKGGAQKWWEQNPSQSVPQELIDGFKSGKVLPRTRAAIRVREILANYASIKFINWQRIQFGGNNCRVLSDFYATS